MQLLLYFPEKVQHLFVLSFPGYLKWISVKLGANARIGLVLEQQLHWRTSRTTQHNRVAKAKIRSLIPQGLNTRSAETGCFSYEKNPSMFEGTLEE